MEPRQKLFLKILAFHFNMEPWPYLHRLHTVSYSMYLIASYMQIPTQLFWLLWILEQCKCVNQKY